jgi:hypothetical protein
LPTTEPEDLELHVMDGDERDDQLWRVPEGCVQEAADSRPGVLGGVLSRFADQPRERHEGGGGEHEVERLRRVNRVVDEDDERRERDRREEDAADHEPAILTAPGQSLDGSPAPGRA